MTCYLLILKGKDGDKIKGVFKDSDAAMEATRTINPSSADTWLIVGPLPVDSLAEVGEG